MSNHPQRFDIALVGAGLANALIALASLRRCPERKVVLIEGARSLGGNHTWSFHTGDVSAVARSFVEPLIAYRWPGYAVRFSKLERRLADEYATVTSERLASVVERAFSQTNSQLLLERRAVAVQPHTVTFADGHSIDADIVIDGRGPESLKPDPDCRYQKFLGLELSLDEPAPWLEPLLMDACVPQGEGLHFMYVLPFTPERVLIEDTYFSDTPNLDVARLEDRVLSYAKQHGLRLGSILRREHGVLPLPLRTPKTSTSSGLLASGFAGGWFHPTTGYSFPLSVRLAEFVAEHASPRTLARGFMRLERERMRQQRYFCFLNRLLYGGFPPAQRINVLEHFYRLPTDTVRRFYSLQTTPSDRARILCGRPPRGLSLSYALAS